MKKGILLSMVLFFVFSAPGVGMPQPFVGSDPANPLGGASPGLVNGGFHFHINPAEDHYAFESLERHSYQYEALQGYEHLKSEGLQHPDRFRDIQYPKDQADNRSSYESFFGVESDNPLKR
jgi:hypothetical protein